jgi:tellurite resistance protein TerC
MDVSAVISTAIIILQVVFFEGVLSLDNIAVLGAVVLSLPESEKVPWPRVLKAFGNVINPLLGNQRTAALRVGLLGAYVGQSAMLVLASFVIRNPWLQLIGAAYLLKISAAELGSNRETDENTADGEGNAGMVTNAGRSFWATVLMVELMDLAFSLDNVVVVVSMTSRLWIVMLGVAIGILTMRFAAGLFTRLIEKVPTLAIAAYILVFNIGVEFILSRLFGIHTPDLLRFVINVGTLLLAVIYDKTPALQRALRLPFGFLRVIFHAVDWVFSAVLFPVGWVFGKLFGWIGVLFKKSRNPSPQPTKPM